MNRIEDIVGCKYCYTELHKSEIEAGTYCCEESATWPLQSTKAYRSKKQISKADVSVRIRTVAKSLNLTTVGQLYRLSLKSIWIKWGYNYRINSERIRKELEELFM